MALVGFQYEPVRLDVNSNFRTRYKVPRGRSETPATHKMELFVTLVDD